MAQPLHRVGDRRCRARRAATAARRPARDALPPSGASASGAEESCRCLCVNLSNT
ncbi:MAG: hypothetical protein MZW92_00075 [Comamonadaceae bacterium]|nr:hypothetical protein [Comamonadaceae bacterium]